VRSRWPRESTFRCARSASSTSIRSASSATSSNSTRRPKRSADPEHALDTLAREELGLNPDELGSPWGAAISSFVSFAAGALLPLAPFVLIPGGQALPTAVGITALALFVVGALLSLFTGRSMLVSGARMLLLGALAGAVTFLIGRLAGVTLG